MGIYNTNVAGTLGNELKNTLSDVAKKLRSANNQITSVTIYVNQVVGKSVSNSESAEILRETNMAIDNMIILLRSNGNKKINFKNGGARVINVDKDPIAIPTSGTIIKFN